jgi:hypothetical protein
VTDWFGTRLGALINEHLQYDTFFRRGDGTYFAMGLEMQLRALDGPQQQALGIMDVKGMIPKAATYEARQPLLEELYQAYQGVINLEPAGETEAEIAALREREIQAQTRLARAYLALQQQDAAEAVTQAELAASRPGSAPRRTETEAP